jgi:hypothetical protein
MHWISHRGNIFGVEKSLENHPDQIEAAINMGFDCEIDVRISKSNKIFLGHDVPTYEVNTKWIESFSMNLWVHCKDWKTLEYFIGTGHNFFFHNTDDYTITSRGYIWAFPGKCFSNKFINVLPEYDTEAKDLGITQSNQAGICSDVIGTIREKLNR